jgi:hypothetical protein
MPVGKGTLQFRGHDRDVFLNAEHVTKYQSDELDIFLADVIP